MTGKRFGQREGPSPGSFGSVLMLTALLAAAHQHSVAAYVDPGSGSMFLQLLLGGIGGLAVILRVYWRRLIAIFRPRDRNETTQRG